MAKVKRNPRIIVSFKPSQYELLSKLGDLQGVAMSRVIRDLFDQVEPMLREMAVALEAAKAAQGQPAAQLIAAMSRLQSTVQDAVTHAVDQGDMFSGQLARATDKLRKRVKKAPGARNRARPK